MTSLVVWPDISPKLGFCGLKQPTHITHANDGSNRLFITEQRGRILLLQGGQIRKKPFLDITDRVSCCGERGLVSIVFLPNFKEKRYFCSNYTDTAGDTVVARFHLSRDPDVADPKSEETILTVKQPYANHDGGQLAFGPDGYLYIGMGNGGSAGDPHSFRSEPLFAPWQDAQDRCRIRQETFRNSGRQSLCEQQGLQA